MIPASPSFNTLLRRYNPISEEITPQLKQAFGVFGDTVLSQFKRFYTANNSNNPVEQLGNFYASLDKELASITDPGIVSGWLKKYKTESQRVKNNTISKIGTPKFLGRNFSAYTNSLITPENIYSDNVQPNIPNPGAKIPHLVSTGMQLPGYITANLVTAGHVLGEIFNSNIAPALNKLGEPNKPHQGNLVPDSKHIERVTKAAPKFVQNILNSFGDAKNFMAQNLGFNKFSVQNKNVSSPNYKLNTLTSEKQVVRVLGTGLIDTRDVASTKQFKPLKPV
jgi:hypothetical protein